MFTKFHKALSVRLDFIYGDVVYLGVGRRAVSWRKLIRDLVKKVCRVFFLKLFTLTKLICWTYQGTKPQVLSLSVSYISGFC